MTRAGAVVLALALLHDVGPSCGKKPRPPVGPWSACGGPFTCGGGTQCVTMDATIDLGNAKTSYVCSMPCAADADCAPMGSGFTCSGKGKLSGGTESRAVCAR
jgi:hypothetical protein